MGQDVYQKLDRQRFWSILVKVAAVAAIAAILSACGGAAEPEVIEREVVVTQEVQVETVVEVDTPEFPEGTTLHILQWSHFVPNYDKWFDSFATAWGDDHGVEVTVDHVNIAEVPPALAAAIDAGEGPTLVELNLGAALYVEGLQDLTDVNMQAQELFGPQAETCTANSYLPATDGWFGFCHGWVPDPGDYDIEKWSSVGYPDGPETWQDLLDGGTAIKEQTGVPLGLGLSPEIDSEMAARAVIWSFGGSVQDENECVTLNSPETVEAVTFMAELYNNAMTEEVFAWNAASNNQGLIAGELSYILNSISAYRSLQKIDPAAADNIGFVPALKGPRGDQHASAHLWYVYAIPEYVGEAETAAAKAFMLHHTANYSAAVFASELYNFPAFPSTTPQLLEEGGWVDVDPYGSRPVDKLTVLRTAEDWVTYLGYPGPSNPAVSDVYARNIISNMMGEAASGDKTPEDAVADAEAQINQIFDEWRAKGFVGCS